MYKSLQACRAVAAVLVVLFHLGLAISADKYFGLTAFSVPFSFGDAGVEFFFVLSGFIILTAHRADVCQPQNLERYLKKRFLRIYPIYWIIFLGIYFLASLSPALRSGIPGDFIAVAWSLLLIPGSDIPGFISVAWTLQDEVLFYFLFSFIILGWWPSAIVALTLIIGFVCFGWAVPLLLSDYMLLFLMGMAASVLVESEQKKNLQSRGLFLRRRNIVFLFGCKQNIGAWLVQ